MSGSASPLFPEAPGLMAALHPLSVPPCGQGWNISELDDLVPDKPGCQAAVLVGLVPRPSGTRVLLTVRADALRQHGGQVSFPGGRIEPGDVDAVAAALRETSEEIGLPPASIMPLGFLDPLATVTGFHVVPVVAGIDPDSVVRPDSEEVARVFEVPLAFLLGPASLQLREIDWRGRRRRIAEFVAHDDAPERIWGATASILQNLRERLAATDG